eukprot:1489403-Pleurochrysis_carterae.AAC.1
MLPPRVSRRDVAPKWLLHVACRQGTVSFLSLAGSVRPSGHTKPLAPTMPKLSARVTTRLPSNSCRLCVDCCLEHTGG